MFLLFAWVFEYLEGPCADKPRIKYPAGALWPGVCLVEFRERYRSAHGTCYERWGPRRIMNEFSPTSLRHTSTPLKSSSLQGIALKDRNPLTGAHCRGNREPDGAAIPGRQTARWRQKRSQLWCSKWVDFVCRNHSGGQLSPPLAAWPSWGLCGMSHICSTNSFHYVWSELDSLLATRSASLSSSPCRLAFTR